MIERVEDLDKLDMISSVTGTVGLRSPGGRNQMLASGQLSLARLERVRNSDALARDQTVIVEVHFQP